MTTTHTDDDKTVTTRDLPKPEFTDAEAGAREFPDSTARRYNYYIPQKRKQSHYEDVTVEVQPDPRHYLSQGWLYGFSDGRGGYPRRSAVDQLRLAGGARRLRGIYVGVAVVSRRHGGLALVWAGITLLLNALIVPLSILRVR